LDSAAVPGRNSRGRDSFRAAPGCTEASGELKTAAL